jgi:hypothetical protein
MDGFMDRKSIEELQLKAKKRQLSLWRKSLMGNIYQGLCRVALDELRKVQDLTDKLKRKGVVCSKIKKIREEE